MRGVSRGIDRIEVIFDDANLVANAGLVVPATLMARLGLAIKAIWTHEQAEFHGDLVDFDPIYQWPKPVQRPHPPVLLGGWGPSTYRRVLDYADGWLPVAAGRSLDQLAAGIGQLQQHAKDQGRGPVPSPRPSPSSPDDLARAADIGVDRALVMLPDGAGEKETLELLDRYTGLLAR